MKPLSKTKSCILLCTAIDALGARDYSLDAWNRLKKSLDAAIDAAEKPK